MFSEDLLTEHSRSYAEPLAAGTRLSSQNPRPQADGSGGQLRGKGSWTRGRQPPEKREDPKLGALTCCVC